jgi:hypothetical protein
LHLSLRNDADSTIADTAPITMHQLRYLEESMATLTLGDDEEDEEEAEPEELASASKVPPGPLLIQTFRANSGGVVYIPRQ